jgi:hypothetical protein
VRAFERTIDGQSWSFAKSESQPVRLLDAQTGSQWDFTGKAVSGPYAGRKLKQIFLLNDYWFDWKAYNPETGVYQ